MKNLRVHSIFSLLTHIFVFHRVAYGQLLTEDDVKSFMESDQIKNGFLQCITDLPHPKKLGITMIIETTGHPTLYSTDPYVDTTTFNCLGAVISKESFKSISNRQQVTYYFEFSEEDVPQIAANEKSILTSANGGCTKDTDCKGNRICTNGICTEIKQSPMREGIIHVRRGKPLVILGGLFLGIGIPLFGTGIILSQTLGRDPYYYNNSEFNNGVAGLICIGGLLAIAGIPIIIIGGVRESRYKRHLQKQKHITYDSKSNNIQVIPTILLIRGGTMGGVIITF